MSDQKLQSTDLLLVNRGAASYNKPYGEVKSNMLDSHIIQSPTPPTLGTYPELGAGTIWIDTSQQPPVQNIWDPTANGGLGGWEEAGGSIKPINPDPTTDIINPPGTGGTGDKLDPFDITNSAGADEVFFGESCASASITINNLREGAIVSFTDENSATNGARFAQPIAIADGTGTWTGQIVFTDAPASTVDGHVYTALLKVGSSDVYYKYDVKVITRVVNPDPNTDLVNPIGTGGTGTITDPFDITNAAGTDEVLFGESCTSAPITINNLREGSVVAFTDTNFGSNGARFTQPSATVDATGTWTGRIVFDDTPSSIISGQVYSGLLKLGSSDVYYKYDVKVMSPTVEPDPTVDIDLGGGPGVVPPGFSGSGTQVDPFILPDVTCFQVGGNVESASVTVINQTAGQFFTVSTISGGVRFAQPQNVVGVDGTSTFKLKYVDTPNSAAGQVYDGEFQLGTTYFKWSVTQVVNSTPILGGDGTTAAPNASPADTNDSSQNLYGTGTGTWADANGTLRVVAATRAAGLDSRVATYDVTDGILFDVNGTNYSAADKAIAVGNTLNVIFDPAKVTAASQGERIAGALTNDAGYYQVFEMVKDGNVQTNSLSIDPLIDQALNTEVESGFLNLVGFNVPIQVDKIDGATPLTSVQISVNGGAYSATFPATVNPGQTVTLKGTTGSVNSEDYTVDITAGGETATWSVTTTDTEATIAQPTITSPADNSKDLGNAVNLVSSSYVGLNNPGPHTTSTWEVYSAPVTFTETDTIVSIDSDGQGHSATMHGLRFDKNRNTILRGSRGSQTFTYSAWVKPTGDMYLLANEVDGLNLDTFIDFRGGKLKVGDSGNFIIEGGTVRDNEWQHIVVSNNSTGDLKGYIDGVLVGSGTLTNPKWTNNPLISGSNAGKTEYTNGYMSDVYFVAGSALEPTVFGKSIDGVWGPIDSSVVEQKIESKTLASPYSERPNYDEKWSDQLQLTPFDASYSAEKAFDGNAATQAQAQTASDSIDWSLPADITGKLEINFGSNNPQKVTEVNGNIIAENLEADGSFKLITDDISTYAGQVIKIQGQSAASAAGSIAQVRLDGRIVLDGPADNSQMWSNYLSGNTSVTNGGNAFDGDTSTNGMGWDGVFNVRPSEGFYDLVFEPPSPIPGPVSVWTNAGNLASGYEGQYQVDTGSGYGALNGAYAQGAWNEIVPAGQNLVKFRIQSGTNGTSFAAMKYGSDDKLLIDSGAQWDVSQVWSDGASVVQGQESGIFTGIFDGVIPSVYTGTDSGGTMVDGASPNASMVIDFPVTQSGEVIIYPYFGTTSTCTIKFGTGTAIDLSAINANNTSFQPINLGVQSFNKITTTQTYVSGALNAFDLAAISVGGKILVDGDLFGSNGFHLPFDPAAQGLAGKKWSDMVSGPAQGYSGSEPLTDAFDGNPNTYCNAASAGGTATFTPNLGSGSFDVEMHAGNDQLASVVTIDGNLGQQETRPGVGEFVIWTGLTSFNEMIIPVDSGVNPGTRVTFYSIKVNGHELIDGVSYSGIGNDASGNANHFQDENFGVGNTSQVWSKGIDVSGVSTAYNSPLNMFDGNTSTEYTVVSGTAVWTPSNPIGTNKVRFYGNYVAASQSVKFNWAGGSYTHTQVVNNTWADVTSSVQFPITSIEFAAGSNGVTVSALEFDNVVLVDGNIADTVLDTPVKNYAVLESATNGNLVATNIQSTQSAATLEISPGDGKYYMEFSSGELNGINLNFDRGSNIFMGTSPNSGGLTNGSVFHQITGPGIIGLAFDASDGSFEVFKDGVSIATDSVIAPPSAYNITCSGNTVIVTHNYGQQPFAYTPPAGYGGLYEGNAASEYVVTFTTDKNLSAMGRGQTLKGKTSNATGKPIDVDSSAKTMTFDTQPGFAIGEVLRNIDIPGQAPGKPATTPPDALVYTSVVNSVDDGSNLTSYALTPDDEKAYYSRVQYKDDTTPDVIESEFSPWHKFTTQDAP